MTEYDLKLLAKIDAIEALVVFLMSNAYESKGLSNPEARELHAAFLKNVRTMGYPKIDPAISDHYSAEVEAALDRLLKAVSLPHGDEKMPPSSHRE